MLMRISLLIWCVCCMFFSPGRAIAQLSSIADGMNWLVANQNADKSWGGNDPSLVTSFNATAEAVEALRICGNTGTAYSDGLTWLNGQAVDSVNFTANRLLVRANAGLDVSSELNSIFTWRNNIDELWGLDGEYSNDISDTALALLALKSANYTDQTVISNAINYLLSNQNTDGGFGFYQGNISNVYMTAIVLHTLQQFPQTTSIATSINKATSYLIAHQNADGGFGSSGSTIYEASLAYIALVGVITDNTVLGNAINYLTSNQSSDGSWNQDAYSSALALRALYLSENKPTPPPVSTTGTLTGRVVDSATNQPLGSVTVTLMSNPAINTLTDAAGSFNLANIPAGSQQISLSLSGYATSTVTTNITAGAVIDIGMVALSVNPTTGIIQGVITDSSNGNPLSGVDITITGVSVWTITTSSDGAYRITDITPRTVTLTASKRGYTTVSGAGSVTAGGTLVFSPSLSTVPPTATTGDLKGVVIDSTTGLLIAGATISAQGPKSYAVTTSSFGAFSISAIEPGSYTVAVTALGYTGLIYTVTIIAGVATDMGTIRLSLAPSAGTVQGIVKDASTGLALSGVTITVTGDTTWTAATGPDGSYQITGIMPGAVSISASKTGYYTVSGTGTVAAGGTLIFSPSLSTTPPTVTTGDLKGSVVDNSTGQPIQGATVFVTAARSYTATTGIHGDFSLTGIYPGTYTVTVSTVGYLSQTYTVSIIAGVMTDMGTVKLSAVPTIGTISGIISDASTGATLEGVTITATIDTSTWQATTGLDGAYEITNVTPGTVFVSASKTGYDTVSGTGTVTAGDALTFSVGLTKIPTTGDLKGTVIDSSTGLSIQGANISVTGITTGATTDAQGAFLIQGINPGGYTVSIAAAGYTGQSYNITIMAGSITDIGNVKLAPAPAVTTVTGRVTDATTGSPITYADVSIPGTNFSTKTDSTGTYTINGITQLEFSIKASATGYDSKSYNISTVAYGAYTVDFALSPSRASDIIITFLATDSTSYSANNNVTITATIENTGSVSQETIIIAEIRDNQGNTVAIARFSDSETVIAPLSSTTVNITWNTGQYSPDDYQVVFKVTEPSAAYYNLPGIVLAEKGTPFTIQPFVGITNSAIKVNPTFAYMGATETMTLALSLTNQSNRPADLVAGYEFKSPSGAVLSSGVTTFSMPLEVVSTNVSLTTFTHTFNESGEYYINVAVHKDGVVLSSISSIFPVLSNIRIEPSRSVTPATVLPNGSGKVRITIELKGVEVK